MGAGAGLKTQILRTSGEAATWTTWQRMSRIGQVAKFPRIDVEAAGGRKAGESLDKKKKDEMRSQGVW